MLNKVILIGRLGADPEVRHMPNGNAVTNINIATNRTWKDRQSGERRDETEWHRIVFFTRLAEIVGEYLRKGSLVYVEGRMRTQKWQDQSGQDKYTTEIVADQMKMLDSKSGGTGNFNSNQSSDGYVAPQQTPDSPLPASREDFDDDIPF